MRSLTVVLFLLCVPPEVSATEGSIAGTISDPSGGVIAGVSVSVRHVTTSAAWTATTDSYGRFVFLKLPVGRDGVICV